jgi:hypothetical protein
MTYIEFRARVSGPEFSISVSCCQRLGSNSHETGLICGRPCW